MVTAKRQNRKVGAPRKTRRKNNTGTVPLVPLTLNDDELYARVALKAYELYQERGEDPGHDLDDWLTAERLVKAALLHGPGPEEPLHEEL